MNFQQDEEDLDIISEKKPYDDTSGTIHNLHTDFDQIYMTVPYPTTETTSPSSPEQIPMTCSHRNLIKYIPPNLAQHTLRKYS